MTARMHGIAREKIEGVKFKRQPTFKKSLDKASARLSDGSDKSHVTNVSDKPISDYRAKQNIKRKKTETK